MCQSPHPAVLCCFSGVVAFSHLPQHAVQISLVDMLYRKSLRITAASKGRMGVGAIVNLQSNDASKLWGMAQYLHILWSGPFQVLTSVCTPNQTTNPVHFCMKYHELQKQ